MKCADNVVSVFDVSFYSCIHHCIVNKDFRNGPHFLSASNGTGGQALQTAAKYSTCIERYL